MRVNKWDLSCSFFFFFQNCGQLINITFIIFLLRYFILFTREFPIFSNNFKKTRNLCFRRFPTVPDLRKYEIRNDSIFQR